MQVVRRRFMKLFVCGIAAYTTPYSLTNHSTSQKCDAERVEFLLSQNRIVHGMVFRLSRAIRMPDQTHLHSCTFFANDNFTSQSGFFLGNQKCSIKWCCFYGNFK